MCGFCSRKKPTGSSDPLGVRRAALGVIRTVIEGNINIDINKYIKRSLDLLPVNNDCFEDIHEFFVQRLNILLSDNFKKNYLDSCANKDPLINLADYVKRVEIVSNLNAPQLLENANRVIRIIKDSKAGSISENYFAEPIEKTLYDEINSIKETNDYQLYLNELEKLNPTVTKFFEDVLVMDKDENIKNNRISLLSLLKEKYDYLADFSKL